MSDDRLLDIASAILDGEPVAWDTLPEPATDAERDFLDQLRLLADVAVAQRASDEAAQHEWGPLRILEPIGSGTYGDVYRAHDPALERDVALKLLRQTASGSAVEGRLLARVRHPNVVTVYGAGEHDGLYGIWMELVQGRTLADLVSQRGPLSPEDVRGTGVDVCRALAAVHGGGLLHGDLKAQNVMRDATGRIVLMDFGTGRVAAQSGSTGRVAGTPLYTAPEVLAGGALDTRADIYSAGVLIYYLLTGSFPVEGLTLSDVRAAHAAGSRQAVRVRRSDIPPRLADAIDRATSPDPSQRFQTAADFEAALEKALASRWPIAAVRGWGIAAALVIAAAVGVGWGKWTSPTNRLASPQWVLVSSFDNHTGDARLDDVVQFALEQELAQSHAVSVVTRERAADTLKLMQRPIDGRVDATLAREICLRDGGIGLFAGGRIDRVGSHYAVNVTLTDARSGRSVARAGVDVPDLDAVLGSVKSLAAQLRSSIGEDQAQLQADAQLEKVTTGSFDALRAYTQGLAFINEHRWPAAEVPLRDAVRLDPAFASAQIMLAHTLRNQGRPAAEYLPAAERAFALSDTLPDREKYFIVGSYYDMTGDVARGAAAYEALVRAHPNDYWGTNNLVADYRRLGQQNEATAAAVKLAVLRPHHFSTLVQAAEATLIQGNVNDARSLVTRATALADAGEQQLPDFHTAWVRLFPVFELWATGHVPEAAARLDAIVAGKRLSSRLAQGVGMMNLALGRLRKADEAFRAMAITDEPFEFLALVEMARGDLNAARAALLGDPRLADIIHRPPPGPSPMDIWLLVRFGLVAEADALLKASELPDDSRVAILASRAELLAARGDDNAAMALLVRLDNLTQPAAHFRFRVLESLVDALLRRGDLQPAASWLARTDGLRPSLYPLAGSSGYSWLRLRARALDVERRLGHFDRARQVEQELRELMQVADPDFAILRELH